MSSVRLKRITAKFAIILMLMMNTFPVFGFINDYQILISRREMDRSFGYVEPSKEDAPRAEDGIYVEILKRLDDIGGDNSFFSYESLFSQFLSPGKQLPETPGIDFKELTQEITARVLSYNPEDMAAGAIESDNPECQAPDCCTKRKLAFREELIKARGAV